LFFTTRSMLKRISPTQPPFHAFQNFTLKLGVRPVLAKKPHHKARLR